MHQLANVIDFSSLKTKKIRDLGKIKILSIGI
jgi:hypothetical protein